MLSWRAARIWKMWHSDFDALLPQNHVSLKKGEGSLMNWCSTVLSIERDRKEKEKMNTARDFKRAKISNRTQKNSLTCALPRKKKKKDKILEFIWHGEVILKFYSYPDIYLQYISGSDTEHAAGKLAICLKHYLGKRFADLPRSTWRTGISLKWLLNAAVLNIYLVHTFCILDWIRWVKISPDESS